MKLTFTESPIFSQTVMAILSVDQLYALEERLLYNPEEGDLIPGGEGLRKIRVASKGKGKRGGSRVIYYWFVAPEVIQFCRIYEKSDKADLSKDELKTVKGEIETAKKARKDKPNR